MEKRKLRQLHSTTHKGFSLVEALVAIVVLSVGLLGVASVQLSTLKLNQVAQQRSIAQLAINTMTDRMRSNLPGVRAGNYAFSFSYDDVFANKPAPVNCTSACTSQQIASFHLERWISELNAMLPEGRGIITGAANGTFRISVMWREKELGNDTNQNLRVDDDDIALVGCPTVAARPTDVQCVSVNFQP